MTPFHRLAYEQLAAGTPPATPTLSQLMDECDNYLQVRVRFPPRDAFFLVFFLCSA